LNRIDTYPKKRDQLNTPIWVGETGEKENAIYWATTQLFEANYIDFSFWPRKKMDTQNILNSIHKPNDWDLISVFTKGSSRPDSIRTGKIFNELLENIKLANCDYFEVVCNAILTRIPAKIEAENYRQERFKCSYFMKDTLHKSKFYRTGEPVKINLDSKDKKQLWSELSIELQPTEWVIHHFNNLDNGKHCLSIRASVAKSAQLTILINNKKVNATIASEVFSEIGEGNYQLNKGKNIVKIMAQSNKVQLDWIKFD